MGDPRATSRASAVGAVREAERLGCPVVGTEHLLLASMADPTVRWAFRTVGADIRLVEAEVVSVSRRRRSLTRNEQITPDAADAVMQASEGRDSLDLDAPDAADVAEVRRALARRFLSRTRHSDARDVLDLLGVFRCRTRVLATIEHNTRLATPPDDGGGSPLVSGRQPTRSAPPGRSDPTPGPSVG